MKMVYVSSQFHSLPWVPREHFIHFGTLFDRGDSARLEHARAGGRTVGFVGQGITGERAGVA